MQILFHFRKVEFCQDWQDVADGKFRERIERFSPKPTSAVISFSADRFRYRIACQFKGGNGLNCHIEAEANDMYVAIDEFGEKLETMLRKRKDKTKSHQRGGKRQLWSQSQRDFDDIGSYGYESDKHRENIRYGKTSNG
jgi:ribosomal subunit interface protein